MFVNIDEGELVAAMEKIGFIVTVTPVTRGGPTGGDCHAVVGIKPA